MKNLVSLLKLKTVNPQGKVMSKDEQIKDLAERTMEQLKKKGIKVNKE